MKTERDFHRSFGLAPSSLPEQVDSTQDDANFHSLFVDGASFQSLLSLPSQLSPLGSSSGSSISIHDFPSLNQTQSESTLDNAFQPPLPLTFPTSQQSDDGLADSSTHQLLDFYSKPLPALCSLEKTQPRFPASSKRARFDTPIMSNSNNNTPTMQGFNSLTQVIPQKEMARQSRQKVSEKMRSLQKLLPWDKKMHNSGMLEEAYKYVRMLQAQIASLQTMPVSSSFAQNEYCNHGFDFGALGRLNRQQMLEVLVNSPPAQTILCSRGLCVFSFEQLLLLNKPAGVRKAVVHPTVALGARVGYRR